MKEAAGAVDGCPGTSIAYGKTESSGANTELFDTVDDSLNGRGFVNGEEEAFKRKLSAHLANRPDKDDLIEQNIIKSFRADPRLQGVMQSLLRTRRESELERLLGMRRSQQQLRDQNILLFERDISPSSIATRKTLTKHLKQNQLKSFLASRPSRDEVARLNLLEDTMTWTRIVQGGILPLPRNCHALAAVGQRLYLTGGYGSGSRTGEMLVYESDSCCWSRPIVAGVLPAERFAHSCSVVGSQLFLFGGCSANGLWLNDVFVLDTEFEQPFYPALRNKKATRGVPQTMLMWYEPEISGEGPCARAAHSATVMGTRIFIFAGNDGNHLFNDLFVLDTESMEWSQPTMQGDFPSPRAGHSAVTVSNSIVVFGGGTHDGSRNDLYVLDTCSMTWYQLRANGTAPSPRFGHSCELVLENKLLVFGGGTMEKVFNDLHMLDMETCTWSRPSDTGAVPLPRGGLAAAMIQSRMYVFGGTDNQGQIFNDLHSLDTAFLHVSHMNKSEIGSKSQPGNCDEQIDVAPSVRSWLLTRILSVSEKINSSIESTQRRIHERRKDSRAHFGQLNVVLEAAETRHAQHFTDLSNEVGHLRKMVSEELSQLQAALLACHTETTENKAVSSE